MRRWLLIMLLLIYPFQVSLAMADQCCVATSTGVTHHAAQGKGAPAAEPVFLADDAVSSLADPHCPACVFGQVAGMPLNVGADPAVAHHAAAIASAMPLIASVPRSRPERPNWPACAR